MTITRTFSIGVFLTLSLLAATPSLAMFKDYDELSSINLAYFGKPDILTERLSIDPLIEISLSPDKQKLSDIDTFFIYDYEVEDTLLEQMMDKISKGEAGLVINLGKNISSDFISKVLGTQVSIEHLRNVEEITTISDTPEPSSIKDLTDLKNINYEDIKEKLSEEKNYGNIVSWAGPKEHPLATAVAWKSAVQVQEYSRINFQNQEQLINDDSIKILTVMNRKSQREKENEVLLLEKTLGQGKIYILTPWFKKGNDEERLEHFWSVLVIKNKNAYNYAFYNWAYFNWLVNFLVRDTSNNDTVPFSKWPHAPVPHDREIIALGLSLVFVFLISFGSFLWVRRHSKLHPEILENIRISNYEEIKNQRLALWKKRMQSPNPVFAFFSSLQYRLNKLVFGEIAKSSDQWERVGFMRPLAGFQMVVACIYLGILPILFFAAIMLNYVVPFPQSIGMTSWVSGAFSLLFTIFDLGTGIAMIKYFAQYRIKNPAKAMQYVQFYIWFQLLSGIVQVSLLVIATASMAPDTAYAFLTWIIIFKLLTQFPGFAAVFHNIFRALQRYDLMILTWVLPIPFSALFSFIAMIWIRSWGLSNPVYGEVMGLSLGDIVPAFIGSWIYIFVSILIYRTLGFSLKATFSAHFDAEVIKKSLSFGLRYTPGAIAPMLSGFALPIIMSIWLNNYLELTSLLAIALWVNFLIRGPGYMLYSNLLPSISEAYTQGCHTLSSHYIDQALKWSLMFVGGVLPYFIILGEDIANVLMPEQWSSASQYIGLAVIFGTIEFLSALPDETFKGVGKPQLFTAVNLFDHCLRIILLLYFVPQYAVFGVLYAYMIAAGIRCVISWVVLSRFIIKLEISWWQSVVTPLFVMLLVLMVSLIIKTFFNMDSSIDALILVGVFFLISPMFYFFTALLGGFDEDNLEEFRAATRLNIITRLMSWIPLLPAQLGARISPLHGRFPLRNWELAQEQARRLTQDKVDF